MKNSGSPLQSLVNIMASVLDGVATPAELADLGRLLHDYPELREDYLDLHAIHGLMEVELASESTRLPMSGGETQTLSLERLTGLSEQEGISLALIELLERERIERIRHEAEVALEKQQWEMMRADREESARWLMRLDSLESDSSSRQYVISKAAFFGGVAALLAVVLVIFWQGGGSGTTPVTHSTLTERVQVATLVKQIDARWERNTHEMTPRGAVYNEKLELVAGLVKLRLGSGAEVIIEAPAVFTLNTANDITLDRGRLVGLCKTRESRGFVVRTPNARVVDLGTEFGVSVRSQKTVVEVFSGAVQLGVARNGDVAGETLLLKDNEAGEVALDAGGQPMLARMDPNTLVESFVRSTDTADSQEDAEAYDRWDAYCKRLAGDNALLVHFRFDLMSVREPILEESRGDRMFDGQIVGADWARGRFHNKGALRFNGPGSQNRVEFSAAASERMNFPGAFTIAVWFKAEPFTARWQNLISKGNSSWRLQRNTLWEKHPELGDPDHQPSAINFGHDDMSQVGLPDLPGKTRVDDRRWHLAVIVFEERGQGGIKRLYIDGRLDAESAPIPPIHATNSRVWIGGNSEYGANREFEGLIDEVIVMRRALDAREIAEMYQAGIPSGF